jgi:uncharacterized membrane protein YjfL (UPF0719 family)
MLYNVARLLQFAGLLILPIAVAGNVAERLSLKDSLIWSGVGVVVFLVGYLLQQTTRPR